jgi:hypothetical protein
MENTLSMTEYNEKTVFENLDEDEKVEYSAFSLESYTKLGEKLRMI